MIDSGISKVFDLKYMKDVRSSLNCIGLWPNEAFEGKSRTSRIFSMLNYTLFIIASMGLVSQVMYLKKNGIYLEFLDLGHECINILMNVILLRLALIWNDVYHAATKEFVQHFHLLHHKQESEFSIKIYFQVNRICSLASVIMHSHLYMCLVLYNLMPLYNNYRAGMFSADRPVNGTFEHSVYLELPFDQYTDIYYYTIMCIVNIAISYVTSCVFCCLELLICLIVFHIWGHLSILKHELEYLACTRLDENAPSLKYTLVENKRIADQLKAIIKYHIMINEFVSKTSRAYSLTLCCCYAFYQMTGCILLLECFSLDPQALVKFGLITLYVFQQLILLSVVFELIGSKGETLVPAVYGLPWERMDAGSRRLVLVLLQNVQRPIALKAGGIVPVGVRTMLAILRTSFSYFLMLKTLATD